MTAQLLTDPWMWFAAFLVLAGVCGAVFAFICWRAPVLTDREDFATEFHRWLHSQPVTKDCPEQERC